ncbi:MAG: site-specific integrase, partial [Sinobacteraceae bacterium]|nr:site-specific integrase [Nevskiaceae bacterium]
LQSTRCEEERAMATTCLRGFHLFLIIEREAEPVTIEGSVIDDGHVRANMISDREYRIVRATLHEQITDKRRRRMLALALLLPYRLGLRRSELRYLRLVDIQRDEHDRRPLLWVHAHPRNRLKTGSSTRRLPLAHLLTDDELHDLVEWLEQRKLECGRDVPVDALLLCPPGQNSAPIEEWQLDLLVAMMREVCGNMSLVFHSLRHSFATNLFGDVMWAGLRDIGAGTRIQQVFPWRTLAPPSTQVKRLFAFDGLPRPGAYLVAALAGHIDPTETMHTYVHLQDYMACLYLRHSAAVTDYPQGFWAALEGITREAMYVRRARDKSRRAKGSHADPPHVDTPRRLLRSLHLRPPPGKQASSQRRASVPDEISKAGLLCLQLDAIYHALSTSMRPMSVEGRALVTGLDPAAFKTLVRHARELASWLTAMRNPAARRSRLLTTHPPRRRPAMSRTPQLDSIGPALPKKHADHGDARTAYQHAVDDPSKVTLVELISLLRSTSRSHAQVRAYSMAGLRQVIKVLDRLGVERPRMHVEVLAWRSKPRKSKGIVASVKRKAPKGLGGITQASNIKRMRPDAAASSDGRFAVKIMSPSGRATMGWRVGCYYAVCVLATQRNIDLQALLARADAARSR